MQEVKVKLVKTLVWPVVTYGVEALTMKKADEKRIEAMEMFVAVGCSECAGQIRERTSQSLNSLICSVSSCDPSKGGR